MWLHFRAINVFGRENCMVIIAKHIIRVEATVMKCQISGTIQKQ